MKPPRCPRDNCVPLLMESHRQSWMPPDRFSVTYLYVCPGCHESPHMYSRGKTHYGPSSPSKQQALRRWKRHLSHVVLPKMEREGLEIGYLYTHVRGRMGDWLTKDGEYRNPFDEKRK